MARSRDDGCMASQLSGVSKLRITFCYCREAHRARFTLAAVSLEMTIAARRLWRNPVSVLPYINSLVDTANKPKHTPAAHASRILTVHSIAQDVFAAYPLLSLPTRSQGPGLRRRLYRGVSTPYRPVRPPRLLRPGTLRSMCLFLRLLTWSSVTLQSSTFTTSRTVTVSRFSAAVTVRRRTRRRLSISPDLCTSTLRCPTRVSGSKCRYNSRNDAQYLLC